MSADRQTVFQSRTNSQIRTSASLRTHPAARSPESPATNPQVPPAANSQPPSIAPVGLRGGSPYSTLNRLTIDRSYLHGEDHEYQTTHNAIRATELVGWPSRPPAGDTPSGTFNNARNVVLNQPVFVEGPHPKDKDLIDFLAQNTIPGAHFDSSERYPPPTCHPGTRLDISEKLVAWIKDLMRKFKIVWLHGPAGVGKSAVIQTLAESEANSPTSVLGATVFFSKPNKRDDPQRLFATIAYQLAVKYPEYRSYIIELLVLDPLLLNKSIVEQFKWFILKPFAEKKLLEGQYGTVLITLDGLDECNGESAQREIIFLLGKFSLKHPTTPLIWIIASRPEPQISTAFLHRDVQDAYMEIDMPVDSDRACRDVERYLRDIFADIKQKYPLSFTPAQQWPTETNFAKIAKRSSGLFAFANTVIRFTSDPEYANPIAQLQKVLDVLDSPLSPAAEDSPFAALDTIYTLILSSVPSKVWPTAQKLLYMMGESSFVCSCNILSISQADAYGALQKLHSVLVIPEPDRAGFDQIKVFHKSFDDYLRSPPRSLSFGLNPHDAQTLILLASIRILLEAYDTIQSSVCLSKISVTWLRNWGLEWEQKLIFNESLNRVTSAPLHRAKELESLRGFFQDLDYARFGKYLCKGGQTSNITNRLLLMPRLKNWGVAKILPVQLLDFNSLDLDQPILVDFDREVPLTKHIPAKTDIAKVVFPPSSQASKVRKWFSEVKYSIAQDGLRPSPKRPGGDQIRRDIEGLPASRSVIVLGRGSKSLVVIGVDISEMAWIYTFRYKKSNAQTY